MSGLHQRVNLGAGSGGALRVTQVPLDSGTSGLDFFLMPLQVRRQILGQNNRSVSKRSEVEGYGVKVGSGDSCRFREQVGKRRTIGIQDRHKLIHPCKERCPFYVQIVTQRQRKGWQRIECCDNLQLGCLEQLKTSVIRSSQRKDIVSGNFLVVSCQLCLPPRHQIGYLGEEVHKCLMLPGQSKSPSGFSNVKAGRPLEQADRGVNEAVDTGKNRRAVGDW